MSRHDDRWPKGDRRGGRFAPKKGGAAEPTPTARARSTPKVNIGKVLQLLPRLSDDQVAIAWAKLHAAPDRPDRDRAIAAFDAELARREGVGKLTRDAGDDPVLALVAKGVSYPEAYAEVHGLDPAKLAREQAAGIIGRRKGETTRDAIRRAHQELVFAEWAEAEDATAGNLLSKAGRAKGIKPTSLWTASPAVAAKYASDELKAWWEARGGRTTSAVFRARYAATGKARRAAQASRQAGAGRDYGV